VKAITAVPHQAGSARLEDFPEPDIRKGTVLVEAIAVGVRGTDVEIVEGHDSRWTYWVGPPVGAKLYHFDRAHDSLARRAGGGEAS
jgi:threonine dehydrogenase-like Zn-dependent dehydrogenase